VWQYLKTLGTTDRDDEGYEYIEIPVPKSDKSEGVILIQHGGDSGRKVGNIFLTYIGEARP
jgi:hypothetical protein